MAEYIEKNDLKEYISGYIKSCNGKPIYTDIDALVGIIDLLEAMPAADAQPVKRGRWICNEELYYNGMTKCSCCEAEFYVEDLQALQGDAECVKFCPNCGADMIEPETTKG